jgi:2-oxoglutarate ferredoxin oxidoreductase subunit beta
MGGPIPITEMLAVLPTVAYAARGTLADAASIGRLRAMLRRAMEIQVKDAGFAIVEVLSNCPVGWGMTAQESIDHLVQVADAYPTGVIVDRLKTTPSGQAAAQPAARPAAVSAAEA